MKEYSFVVEDFLPEESLSPDALLLQMTVDKAGKFLKGFSDAVKGAKMFHPNTPETTMFAIVICGSIFLDTINAIRLSGLRPVLPLVGPSVITALSRDADTLTLKRPDQQ